MDTLSDGCDDIIVGRDVIDSLADSREAFWHRIDDEVGTRTRRDGAEFSDAWSKADNRPRV